MTHVFLGLGSNLEREKNIRAGLAALESLFGELVLSKVYESESVGFKGSHFYNMVVSLKTDLSIACLSEALKKIEDDHGRVRTGPKYSPRTLDIDILTYGDFVGVEAGIELPRAEITQNAFVLLPLSEIAPQKLHPQLKKSYADLWQAYDQGCQALWPISLPS
ncbi:2-amino-4-hydroxy-6-hydroxymethyldihydropteridine diphosphokinase [Cellvibrio zantedeschiae]|uniref:2-amino-4-hydroxy-6-hydroxymethyldihydropteridine diphosphokinase n=1 Tax=Cellvibrio zantedeschiae TaxID=1237077 RepID=A0ABQ3AMX6_9GAMM|nr:2-amino-4-hydroxy-6-hydroxymethyldihydropteridine diphosphokinase [Cellvibrio zantedeschiae]GGY61610.1 2-amino-4-hydroxy-6-hydroxymethyldihydropteridine diphosphokinase [Cellvibrio zantedeschiae]